MAQSTSWNAAAPPAPRQRPGRGRRVLSRLLTAVLVVVGSVGYASVATAAPSKSEAIWIFYRSNKSFMSIRDQRTNYPDYDWSENGCSVPSAAKLVPSIGYASRYFNKQCVQHDFGYANFGGRLDLDNTLSRKYSVDRQFYGVMQDRCGDIWWGARAVCRGHAWIFYQAVYWFGQFS